MRNIVHFDHSYDVRLIPLAAVWFALNLAFLAVTEALDPVPPPRREGPSAWVLERYETLDDLAHDLPASRFTLPLRIMRPERSPAAAHFPLLIFLHGAGERGSDNMRQLRTFPTQLARAEQRREFPCFVFAPQCPSNTDWSDWMNDLERAIVTLIDAYPIDRRRVYLTGLSMGGFGCWQLAARRPDLFAAVVPVCGGGDPVWAAELVQVPLWAVHGDADNVVSVETSRTMIQAITVAGGAPNYTELPGVGHDCWTRTYSDADGVLTWMFQQVNDRLPAASMKSTR